MLPRDWRKILSQMNIIAKIYEIIKYLKNEKNQKLKKMKIGKMAQNNPK